jgi:hypothetical protein
MPITHPFAVGQSVSPLGPSNVLVLSQGGVTTVPITPQIQSTSTPDTYTKLSFAWGGNIFLPQGSIASTGVGWLSYNRNSSKFDWASLAGNARRFIPFGQYVAQMVSISNVQRGTHPFNTIGPADAMTASGYEDFVIHGQNIHFLANGNQRMGLWAYPFDTTPSISGALGFSPTRLAVHNNKVYMVRVNSGGAGSTELYEWQGGSTWTLIGSGTVLPENTDLKTGATSNSFFSYGGKLWLICVYDSTATYKVRIFEVDPALGDFTDRQSTHNPSGWNSSTAFNDDKIFEVIDDIGSSRQVYVVRCGSRTNGSYEIIDFQDGANAIDPGNTGGSFIWPYCGVLWDSSAEGAHIKSAVDSSPSSYISMQIAVSDLTFNTNVDIDPRWNDLTDLAAAAPYSQCTEMTGVGSEGKTGLSSKPAGITSLLDLLDTFGDGVIDTDRWQIMNLAMDQVGYDKGNIYSINDPFMAIEEFSGPPQNYLKLGGTSPAPIIDADSGIGIVSKWWVEDGCFFDIKLHNLANLVSNAGRNFNLVFALKEANNRGAFIRIFRTAAGAAGLFARAGYWLDDNTVVESADSVNNPADGQKIRLGRDGSDIWSAILDVDGAAEDINGGIIPNFSGPFKIYLFAYSETTANWALNNDAPGFYELDVVAAIGSLGTFDGEQEHLFAWDHVTDLGGNVSKGIGLLVDTE